MKARSALLAAAAIFCTASAWGQDHYPSRAMRLVVGFPPGSAADVVARIISPRLAEGLGQPVLVENKPGAGSNIAAESVARSSADGYTLFFGSVANAINTTLTKGLSFDFERDFVPVSGIATLPNILVVHPSIDARSVRDLIAVAKDKPGAILYGSAGNGTSPHLSGELFNLMAGVKLVHIPYKGSPQAVADLLAGRVQVMFSPPSTVLPQIKAGRLRALASTGSRRASVAPDLPTIAESGLPGFETTIWFGLFAPAGTPREIVDRLSRETARVLGTPGVKSQLASQGVDIMPSTPAELGEYVRSETDKWSQVVRASGARVD